MFAVSLNSILFEDDQMTYNLAAGITSAHVGRAVTIDATSPNTMKLAGDGDIIYGRLETVEDRSIEGQLVGTVARKFSGKLPVKVGESIDVGDAIVGAGSGEVKAKATPAGWERTIAFMAAANGYVVVQHGLN